MMTFLDVNCRLRINPVLCIISLNMGINAYPFESRAGKQETKMIELARLCGLVYLSPGKSS